MGRLVAAGGNGEGSGESAMRSRGVVGGARRVQGDIDD